MRVSIDSHRVRFSTVIALGTLAFGYIGAHAANLDEVTVTVPSGKIGLPEFPWSRNIDFDPSTSVTTIKIGKGCHVSFVLTAFSATCSSEAARADLFDPKYRVPALELPAPALSKLDPIPLQ